MDSHRRRRSSPADPFSFIKIILSNDLNSARIKIPEKFTEKHRGNFPEKVTFKVPNGDIWQVDLKNSNGAIWFNNGWVEFAEHYNLRFGHLLNFKYGGFSNFSVSIFDPSACEMTYPKNQNHQLAHNSTEFKGRRSLDSGVKVNLDESETVKSEKEACSSLGQDQETEIKTDGEGEGEGEVECSSMRVSKSRKMKAVKALKAAKARFKSDKPFFMVYMNSFHIVGRNSVRIPLGFVRKNWSGLKKVERCVLRVGMDKRYKKWEIGLCDYALRMGGWKIFMKDNGVSVDDVCIFELMDPHQNFFKVTIFRS